MRSSRSLTDPATAGTRTALSDAAWIVFALAEYNPDNRPASGAVKRFLIRSPVDAAEQEPRRHRLQCAVPSRLDGDQQALRLLRGVQQDAGIDRDGVPRAVRRCHAERPSAGQCQRHLLQRGRGDAARRRSDPRPVRVRPGLPGRARSLERRARGRSAARRQRHPRRRWHARHVRAQQGRAIVATATAVTSDGFAGAPRRVARPRQLRRDRVRRRHRFEAARHHGR